MAGAAAGGGLALAGSWSVLMRGFQRGDRFSSSPRSGGPTGGSHGAFACALRHPVTTAKALVSCMVALALWSCPHPALHPEDDWQCEPLAQYLWLTLGYLAVDQLIFAAMFLGCLDRCGPSMVVAALLVVGYVLVGWGLFVVVWDYELGRDKCQPVLLYTAMFLVALRALHTNLVECYAAMFFLEAVGARELEAPLVPEALPELLATSEGAGEVSGTGQES